MYLIETAPHNYGSNKEYLGVVGNLVAFACKVSFESGFGGFAAFTAKTELVHHYTQTLGAQLIYSKSRMAIFPEAAGKIRISEISSMAGKKKYYKLDDIGIVGKQEKKTSSSQHYHTRKTGSIFNAARQLLRGEKKVKGIRT